MAQQKSDVPQTMQEGLQALLPDIANCMAAPDADIDFLDKLQKLVLLKLHSPAGKQQPGPGGTATPGGAAPGGASPSAGIPGAGVPGGPPGGGAPNGQMVSGAAPEAPTEPGGVSKPMNRINPDEMRRIISESAGA